MFVCVCKAVSDRRIREAVDAGVTSLRELTRNTGLGTCCGKCVPQAREVLVARLQTSEVIPAEAASALSANAM